jgi:C-terminal processing protease CtpA/Prc
VIAAKPFLLSDRSFLLVAAKRVTVDGVILEGKGVTPTVSVPREIAYAAGEDQPLREACRIASHS